MKAFKIKIDNRLVDYRIGHELDLNGVRYFIENQGYKINKFLPGGRHINAVLSNPELSDELLFMKLATSKGIGIVTQNEFEWNDLAYGKINVPKNYVRGYYKKNLFYMITSSFIGRLFDDNIATKNIDEIIHLSEEIMTLKIPPLPADKYTDGNDHVEKFLNKVTSHLNSIPREIRIKYNLPDFLDKVRETAPELECVPRHGDFTPWHMILTSDNKIGLIDGEHAMSQGVQYYDIGYFIQRVFAEWKNINLAKKIHQRLLEKGYDRGKLKIIILARTIGGFLDESLKPNPDYSIHNDLKDWAMSLPA